MCREDEEEDVCSYWLTLRKREDTRGSSRSHCLENSLWKRLWTCRKTECGMDGWMDGWMDEYCYLFLIIYRVALFQNRAI
jgi:hypothetical protein